MSQVLAASDIAQGVSSGALSAEHLCEQAIERARRSEHLHAVRSLDPQRALDSAARIGDRLRAGERLPLAGVPMLVKENISQQGIPTLAGRPDNGAPPAQRDAAVVRALQAAGAVIIGRATMDELAYGVSGANGHTGQVLHPEHPDYHPGGSSAGSASAVGTGIVPAALGTDTGGSVRIPAGLCGLVGIRPASGTVSLEGVAPLSPTLDTVGPIARTVRDAALVLSVLLGNVSVHEASVEARTVEGSALALDGLFPLELEPETASRFEHALRVLHEHGVKVERGELAPLEQATRVAGPIIGAEASHAWLHELDAHPERFGQEVAGLLRKGASILATRYLRSMHDRRMLTADVDRLLERHRWLVLPTTTGPSTKCKEPVPQLRFLALTTGFSLTGHPSASLPMGRVGGLPVGLQIVARRGDETGLLRLMAAIETDLSS